MLIMINNGILVGQGKMPEEIAKKLIMLDPGSESCWEALSILSNNRGQERIKKMICFLHGIRVPKNNNFDTNSNSHLIEGLLTAAFSTIFPTDGINLLVNFLEEISKIPDNTLVNKWGIDFTPTLKATAGLSALKWEGIRFVDNDNPFNENFTKFNYELFINAIVILLTKGKKTKTKDFILFNEGNKGAPISDLSYWLSSIHWKMYPGKSVIDVLLKLSENEILSDGPVNDLFVDRFAFEVAHKQTSYITPKKSVEILGAHFLKK